MSRPSRTTASASDIARFAAGVIRKLREEKYQSDAIGKIDTTARLGMDYRCAGLREAIRIVQRQLEKRTPTPKKARRRG